MKPNDTTTKNDVQSTTDYAQFNLFESNRHTTKNHVDSVRRSIEAHPELLPSQPILVNEDMEVIDGQHRLAACQQLGLPVYYRVIEGDIETAQTLNSVHKKWGLLDFARSYSLGKIKDDDPHRAAKTERAKRYTEFLSLVEEFSTLTPNLILMIATQRVGTQEGKFGTNAKFREGKFKIADIDTVRAHLMLIQGLQGIVPKEVLNTGAFIGAMLTIFSNEEYDHDRMVSKLETLEPLRKQVGRLGYLRELERVYNYKRVPGSGGYLRLFN